MTSLPRSPKPSPAYRPTLRATAALLALLVASTLPAREARASESPAPASPETFLVLLEGGEGESSDALERIAEPWHPGSAVMLVELLPFLRDSGRARQVVRFLERRTGQRHGYDLDAWYRWVWSRDEEPHPAYATFKSLLYRNIDPRFGGYFDAARESRIRLDEVRWGGVLQDGIPPLRSPAMISAEEATYLDPGDTVFGIYLGGEARAYPKRILAWHEMFTDVIAGEAVAGVYCTLCGTVILYRTRVGDVDHRLGTSGFLYRSNKLMYDQATQSLWSTLKGEPVIGPLVGRGIQLPRGSVVTTTWEEWRRRHPQTRVLSLTTGHRRDYSEGAAYREYFATDELMFEVPHQDRRLANKAEVLALLFPEAPGETLALAQRFLLRNPVHHDRLGEVDFVVLTSPGGANRVYRSGGRRFASWDGEGTARAEDGTTWTVTEDALLPPEGAGDGLAPLPRLPSQRAFWFGWRAAFPQTAW